MRKPLVGFCFRWAFVLASLFVVGTRPASADLKAHFRFDGDLKDAAGQHHGKPVDPKVEPAFGWGVCGDALLVKSANAGVAVARPEAIDLSRDYSVAAWVKTRFGSGPYERTILFKGHRDAFASPDKHFSVFGDKGILLYAGGQGSWGTSFAATHKIEAHDGKWHFVAVTYSVSKEPHLVFYVDGHRKLPADDGNFMGGDFLMRPDVADSVLRIGCRADGESPHIFGLLDEVQIYDHALTAEDVQFLFAHPGSNSDTKQIVHPKPRMRVDPGHPWRPPFGIERVGQPQTVIVQFPSNENPLPEHWLAGYQDGKEVDRKALSVAGTPPFTVEVRLGSSCDELALCSEDGQGKPIELARWPVARSDFEADAEASSDPVINPVDLGTIFPPTGWLILSPKQKGIVRVAAFSGKTISGAQAVAWFESSPGRRTAVPIELAKNKRAETNLALPQASFARDRDTVHVAIVGADGREIWQKKIPVMLVSRPPQLPNFGATETKLRYDAPISVRAADGWLSSMDYADGWKPELNDVVVSLPNGSRFVFWRGSSYVPFWAGRFNSGLCYEWAETSPPPDGLDCVEPLMDKELRYGRVTIVESTPARVHVRWTYQSCDFNYKVWGDSAVEDYYFYPDGFGTRVLTLTSAPDGDYELSEFIILTPQATYPLSVLPANLVDILFLDGRKHELQFPFLERGYDLEEALSGERPAVYRVRLNSRETSTGIYFNPNDPRLPAHVFRPFFSGEYLVTPVYWGCHWPLARGRTTGYAIDERIGLTPAHNSIMSWARRRPAPLEKELVDTVDTLGRARQMLVQKWAWLIGKTDAPDERLLEWARSYADPPELDITGGRFDSHVPQRRAHRIAVEANAVNIRIRPTVRCVNPVFELADTPKTLASVKLSDRSLARDHYAWDGQTLWLNANIDEPTTLALQFGDLVRLPTHEPEQSPGGSAAQDQPYRANSPP